MSYHGVLIDWSGTVAHDPDLAARLRWALCSLDRPHDDEAVFPLLDGHRRAEQAPEIIDAVRDYDCDARRHRAAKMLLYQWAGYDTDFANRLYAFDTHAANRPLFVDVVDVLVRIRRSGRRLVLLSDIHFDLRVLLGGQGIADLFDDFALSFECGLQKPDPRFFQLGLDRLGTSADRTLMVGDVAAKDGGAAEIGITTLILPRQVAHPDLPRLGPLASILDLRPGPETSALCPR